MTNYHELIGARGPGVQLRFYLKNKTFKSLFDRRLADMAARDGVTVANEINDLIARAILPENDRAARYVFDVCIRDGYGVAQAMGDIFLEAVENGGISYSGMREFVGFYADFVRKSGSWLASAMDRGEAAGRWRKVSDRIAAGADGAPVDVKFDILFSADEAYRLASHMESERGIPETPDRFVRVILRNWAALRNERSTYEFLAALAAECEFGEGDEPGTRLKFQEVAENLLSHWDGGETEPKDADPMAQIRLSAGDYVRVPKDFVLLNVEDAEGCSDAVVIELAGAEAQHFLFFTDDPVAVLKNWNGCREEALDLVKRALARLGVNDDALSKASFVGFYRLPDAGECQERPPYGAAVYRFSGELPLIRDTW